MKYLIAGLGNIGAEYTETRHNIGFKVVDALAKAAGVAFETGRYGSVAELKYKGRTFILLKPSTYMNLSGKAVGYWLKTEKIPIENLFVVVDDIALPFGTLRIRGKGSDGGHNGIKSIIYLTGSDQFPRIKVGVGKKPHPDYDLAAWVLGHFSKEELKTLEEVYEHCYQALGEMLKGNIDRAMNLFN